MRIVRFLDAADQIHCGSQHDDGSILRIEGDIFAEYHLTDERVTMDKLLAPITPTAVLCIGLNYRRHAEEGNKPIPQHPVLFMKMPTALQNPDDPIRRPTHLPSQEVDFEAELAVVIGKPCKNATRDNALDYVLGYTCANDVSARDWQLKFGGGQWCRGKTFDTFLPLGPCLVTTEDIANPNDLEIKSLLNGRVMQEAHTGDMIFDIPRLIEFLSGSTTLAPGTVILTGTPHGVGFARQPPVFLQDGDEVTIEIEKIGALTNPVQDE